MIARRGILGVLGGLIVAPAVITRPGLLMPVASPRPDPLMTLMLEGVGRDGVRWARTVKAMKPEPDGMVSFAFGWGREPLPWGFITRADYAVRVPGVPEVFRGSSLHEGMPIATGPATRNIFEWSIGA